MAKGFTTQTSTPTNGDKTHRVFIVEDHPLMRAALRHALESDRRLKVCGEAAGLDAAMEAILASPPDLLLVDLTLQDGSGLDLLKMLDANKMHIPTLVFSVHAEEIYADRAIAAGASGYLQKDAEPALILEAIHRILAGEKFFSPRAVNRVLAQTLHGGRGNGHAGVARLSDRELETLALLGRGMSIQQIAESLKVSAKTIDTYRQRIKQKLSLKLNGELMRFAVEWSLRNEIAASGSAPAGSAPPSDRAKFVREDAELPDTDHKEADPIV